MLVFPEHRGQEHTRSRRSSSSRRPPTSEESGSPTIRASACKVTALMHAWALPRQTASLFLSPSRPLPLPGLPLSPRAHPKGGIPDWTRGRKLFACLCKFSTNSRCLMVRPRRSDPCLHEGVRHSLWPVRSHLAALQATPASPSIPRGQGRRRERVGQGPDCARTRLCRMVMRMMMTERRRAYPPPTLLNVLLFLASQGRLVPRPESGQVLPVQSRLRSHGHGALLAAVPARV